MTQGIFIDGKRPKSKKAIKEAFTSGTSQVLAEATSWHGGEPQGVIENMPVGTEIVFCGPDPFRDRRFYGTIKVTAKGIRVS